MVVDYNGQGRGDLEQNIFKVPLSSKLQICRQERHVIFFLNKAYQICFHYQKTPSHHTNVGYYRKVEKFKRKSHPIFYPQSQSHFSRFPSGGSLVCPFPSSFVTYLVPSISHSFPHPPTPGVLWPRAETHPNRGAPHTLLFS